jgi:hypothetical protein
MGTVILSPDYTLKSAGKLPSTSHILMSHEFLGNPVKCQVLT